MVRTARIPVARTRRAVAGTAVAVALCAGCGGHGAPGAAAAPVASRHLPNVAPAQQTSLAGFLDGPQGPYVNLPASYLFSLNSAVIRPSAAAGLRKLLPAIRRRSGPVTVLGYTDGLGTLARNRVLSQERADSVRQWLADNGIDSSRIKARGMGEAASAIEPTQRRVEIILK